MLKNGLSLSVNVQLSSKVPATSRYFPQRGIEVLTTERKVRLTYISR